MFSARESTDPDGDPLRYSWTFVGFPDGGRDDSLVEQGREYLDDGAYTIKLIVIDSAGAKDTASTTLTVMNAAPVVAVRPPLQQAVGIPASALVAVSDSGRQDTHTIVIGWGDGTRDSLAPGNTIMIHTYAQPGSYWVEATARDDDGGVGSATATHPVLVFDATEHRSVAGYDVFDLGSLGGNWARPLDFNDHGKVVGASLTASGATHAFVWEDGVMRDLGTMGQEGSEAQRINNAGLIAGAVWSGRSEDCAHPWNAATWRNGSGTILGRGGDIYERYPTSAAALNESGDIVWTACGHESSYAWLWRGGWQRLGALIHPLGSSYGTAINEHGQIVGTSDAVYGGDTPGALPHAFLWEDGAMRDLGLLGFKPCASDPNRNCGATSATDINESGQVVGFGTAADGSVHAVLWENNTIRSLWVTPHREYGSVGLAAVINDRGQVAGSAEGEGFFWSDGMLHGLGSLGGGSTTVVDMNEAGTVVGTSMSAGGEPHAFVWTQGQGMVDLGTGPHGFNAAGVVGISFSGDIVGYTAPCVLNYANPCTFPNEPRAILWRRTP